MIRIVVENVLLFLLPTLIYLAYVFLTQGRKATTGMVMSDAPVFWLVMAGAVLVVVTLLAFGTVSGGKPGQIYEPAVVRDGKIEQGKLR
jgi:hypothetical protein